MFYHLKMRMIEKVLGDILSNRINEMEDQWRKIFDQPVKNDLRTYENIQKITTGQGYDYRAGCLLDYSISKNIIR